MSRQIQIRRGTAAEHENFTGAIGEITMDTTNKTLRVHDGETAGGTVLAKSSQLPPASADYVIETQLPTAENNYTWYRKYKSGWIEQGGRTTSQTIAFPITMQTTNYAISLCGECQTTKNNITVLGVRNITTTGFTVQGNIVNNASQSSGSNTSRKYWRISGI